MRRPPRDHCHRHGARRVPERGQCRLHGGGKGGELHLRRQTFECGVKRHDTGDEPRAGEIQRLKACAQRSGSGGLEHGVGFVERGAQRGLALVHAMLALREVGRLAGRHRLEQIRDREPAI